MTVEKSRQPFIVDVSRPGPALAVEIDASEAAELLLTLATLPEADRDDTYVLGAERLEQVRAEAPPELLAAAELLLPGKSAAQLLGLVYLTPKPRTAAAFIELVEATDPIELRLHLLGYYMRGHHVSSPQTIRGAAEGDLGARAELLDALSDYVEKCSDVSRVLDLDPLENKRALIELLSGWYDAVVANIGAAELIALAPAVVSRLAPDGWLGLSGMSPAQASTVVAAYAGLVVDAERRDDDWAAVVLTHAAGAPRRRHRPARVPPAIRSASVRRSGG